MNSTRQVGERVSDTQECSSIPSPVIFWCEECSNFYGSDPTSAQISRVSQTYSSGWKWTRRCARRAVYEVGRPAECFTDVVKNLLVSDKGVEHKLTRAGGGGGTSGDRRGGILGWNKAWRVFVFAMEVLGAATRTRLERYSDRIQQVAEDYHDLWWIIPCAHKLHKLHLERIRCRLATEHSELLRVGLPSSFQPAAPWDLAFREAARDDYFWATEVDKKVLQYCTAQRTRNQLMDSGFGAIRYVNQGN